MNPSDEIIQLKVTKPGFQEEILNVHRGVLGKSSSFFRNIMKPEWAALREQPDVVELPEDSVQTVSNYIRWLYSGSLAIQLYDAGKDTPEKTAEETEKVFVLLAEAYVFGEKVIDTEYKNAVMVNVIAAMDRSTWSTGPDSVNIIYRGTPCTSPLRRLVSNRAAYCAYDDSKEGDGWMNFFDGYPREALVDAIQAMVRVRDKPKDKYRNEISLYLEKEEEGENRK